MPSYQTNVFETIHPRHSLRSHSDSICPKKKLIKSLTIVSLLGLLVTAPSLKSSLINSSCSASMYLRCGLIIITAIHLTFLQAVPNNIPRSGEDKWRGQSNLTLTVSDLSADLTSQEDDTDLPKSNNVTPQLKGGYICEPTGFIMSDYLHVKGAMDQWVSPGRELAPRTNFYLVYGSACIFICNNSRHEDFFVNSDSLTLALNGIADDCPGDTSGIYVFKSFTIGRINKSQATQACYIL